MLKRKEIHTELVVDDHEYTSVDVPWQIDGEDGNPRLFRYLRSGGVRAFGTTSREVERVRRQNRFLLAAAVFAVIWLLLYATSLLAVA